MAEYHPDPVKIEVFLDDDAEPVGVYRPPATFELDTTKLPDGPHRLRFRAHDSTGVMGVREVDFMVRNGPGIAVVGVTNGDIVEGRIPVLVNAYAGTHDERWEPTRAETPAPVPTWAWILFLLVSVWAGYYWFDTGFFPPEEYANSPTFSSPATIAAAAGQPAAAGAAAAQAFDWKQLGADVYSERCALCHGGAGEGVPRFVPSLHADVSVTAADPSEMLGRILFGTPGAQPAAPAGGAGWRAWMPPFHDVLNDEEIAAVANHVRNSWGNRAPVVAPSQVQALRARK